MDPLSFDIEMTEVDTSMPRLPKGEYLFGIKSGEIKENKEQTGHNLLVIFELRNAATGLNGEPISAGYQIRRYYPLQQSQKENAPDFRRDIAVLLDAAYKVKDAKDRPKLNNETIAGLAQRNVVLSIKVKDDPAYGLVNEIGSVKSVD